MIHQYGAAHSGQGDTRLAPGAHWRLRRNRIEVLIEIVTPQVFISCYVEKFILISDAQ
jgi:hypothetical protein